MLEVNKLSKLYGKSLAVDNISFSVTNGIIGLLGKNGAGKSTTMNMISGYLAPSAGSVFIDGVDLSSDPVRAKSKLGYLPEKPPLYHEMTAREYLTFVFELKNVRHLQQKQHLDAVCDQVGIAHLQHRLIRNLSKGYCQRVGIAQALVGNPSLVILDEPMVGLDPVQIIEMRDLVISLGKERTVILSSHILPEVQEVCDRILVINEGRLIADGSTQQLCDTLGNGQLVLTIAAASGQVVPLLEPIFGIGTVVELPCTDQGCCSFSLVQQSRDDKRRELFFALALHNLPILELRMGASTLEDAFVSLTDTHAEIGGQSS